MNWRKLIFRSSKDVMVHYAAIHSLYRVRYSEVWALLNVSRLTVEAFSNPEEKREVNLELLIAQQTLIREWAMHLLEDEEINSNESELFYHGLLSQHPSFTLLELKVAYYSKLGLAPKKIEVKKRIEVNLYNRIRKRLKRKLRLREKESLSYYLSYFN
jgi:hypothetical protein